MSETASPANVIAQPSAAEIAAAVTASSAPATARLATETAQHENLLERLGLEKKPATTGNLAAAATAASPAPAAPAPSESILQKFEGELVTIGKDTISVLDKIGSITDKTLVEASTYLPEATAIASIIYPPATAALAPINAFVQLAMSAVTEIKAKEAALPAGLTSAQMLADELQLIEPTAIQLLAAAGIKADSAYIQKIVSFIVALLDLKQVPATAAA